MITARLTGGLGNQPFQHAMGRRVAVLHRTTLLVGSLIMAHMEISFE